MARAQDLAGLAALAGLGYMLSKKGDTASTDTDTSAGPGRQSLGAGYNSTETRAADSDNATANAYPSGVMGGARQSNAAPTNVAPVGKPKDNRTEVIKASPPKPVSEPSDKSIKLAPENRDLESDLRSSRGSSASTTNVNYSNEAPIPGAKAIPVLPLGSSDKKTYERKKGATAKEIKAYNDQKAEQERINKLRSSGGMRAKGGAIKAKKMASGGSVSKVSSASKRADGIASKGKTKCKMY